MTEPPRRCWVPGCYNESSGHTPLCWHCKNKLPAASREHIYHTNKGKQRDEIWQAAVAAVVAVNEYEARCRGPRDG